MNKLAALLKSAEAIGAKNSKGGQDTELAHISQKESRLLKLLGGSGRVDPVTKLRHYDTGDNDDSSGNSYGDGSGYSSDQSNQNDSGYTGGADQDANDAWGAFAGLDTGIQNDAWSSFGSALSDALGGVGESIGGAIDSAADESGGAQDAWSSFGGAIENTLGDAFESVGGAMDTAGLADGGSTTIDDDGSGKGRSGTAFGPGGELESFGNWSQEFGNTIGSLGWDADKSNAWMNSLLGYDASKTSLSDVAGSLGFGRSQQAPQGVARSEEDIVNDMGLSGARSSRTETTPAAINEYNSLGWQGALTDSPWSYTDLEGGGRTNWGAIANDVAGVVQNPITGAIAAATGLGPAYGLVSSAINAARGNYTPGLTSLAGILGGPQAALGVGALSNLVSGTPGNTIAGLGSGYLNSVSPGLGSILNASGLTGLGARGINDAYNMALDDIGYASVDGDLSSEGSWAASDYSAPSGMGDMASFAAPETIEAIEAPVFASGMGPSGIIGSGGGGANDFSDYSSADEFLGSKKKTRYQMNQLMTLLGGDRAA